MPKHQMLISYQPGEECRVAILEDGILEDYHTERPATANRVNNLYLGKGQLAPSNAALVAKMRHILEELSIDIASADEARTLLATKGGSNVKF